MKSLTKFAIFFVLGMCSYNTFPSAVFSKAMAGHEKDLKEAEKREAETVKDGWCDPVNTAKLYYDKVEYQKYRILALERAVKKLAKDAGRNVGDVLAEEGLSK